MTDIEALTRKRLDTEAAVILPPQDGISVLQSIREPVTTTILDPWYNKGVGGVREDYHHRTTTVVAG